MKIIITGATGMVGSEVLRQALNNETFTQVTIIVRKEVGITHPKLRTIIHKDFTDYSGLESVFSSHEACLWCLGISQNVVDEKQYIIITYDYALAAANAMLKASPGITLLFLSGDGAKSDEKSRMLFGRIKGKTENALLRLPFKKLYIARPAGILPVNNPVDLPFALKMQYALVRIMRFIVPGFIINSDDLAKALLYIVSSKQAQTMYDYKEIKQLSQKLKER